MIVCLNSKNSQPFAPIPIAKSLKKDQRTIQNLSKMATQSHGLTNEIMHYCTIRFINHLSDEDSFKVIAFYKHHNV